MLTIQEIISAPPFIHAEIMGGWEGKERSFSIVQNHSISLEEPSLLLLAKTQSTIMQLPEYLSNQDVQGILLYGNDDLLIPTTFMETADSYKKPVLMINEQNPESIKQKIADLKHLKSIGLFQYIWERSTSYWLQLMNERGLPGLLQRLCVFLGQNVLLLDEDFQFHSGNESPATSGQVALVKSLSNQPYKNKKEAFKIVENESGRYLLFHLQSGEKRCGFILLQELPGMMIDICIEQIIHAIPAIISYLMKEDAVKQAHRSYKELFLYNLLYNNLESENGLIQQGKQWGWDFTKTTQLMVMRLDRKTDFPNGNVDLDAIMRKIRSLISAAFLQAIIFPIQGNIVMIVFDTPDHTPKELKERMLVLANRIHKEIEHSLDTIECQIGLGRHYPSNMQLFRSFYEAKVALELGKYESRHRSVRHFEDIGIARLLSNVHNDLLHEYFEATLGELIVLDEENDDFYMVTLEAFYNHNGDINQTAEQLYIHPNTLRKRLKKLESILNVDFNQMEDMLKIFVALKIRKILK
ncbi:PucR family transcriptional regulator [Neobacillus drentensis]|uniref:PucR family transcriptional regulator n=1 Tax=Neobacillus drentensis TaxID=220684 RepID=UPI000825F494|nr:helix-turn-helix domain-containing protein [Neobacillus drentensis]